MDRVMKIWYYTIEAVLIVLCGFAFYYGEHTNLILLAILIEVRQICLHMKTNWR